MPRVKNDQGETIPNIVIIGQTGAGKSYYANGLMGQLDPSIGFFETSNSNNSCTRNVKGALTSFYGGRLASYNVKPFLMNLFDTPGFANNDLCQIEKNKERIAATLSEPIHAFIFLADHLNSRTDENQQKLFTMLNEWTMGHIWSNFILAFPRMTFDRQNKLDRIDKSTSFHKNLIAKKQELKQKLWEIASEQEWKKRDQNDKLIPMEKLDFDNIRVNALNVHQNKVCEFTDEGRIDKNESDLKRCSQLAFFDESLDYVKKEDAQYDDSQYDDPFASDENADPFSLVEYKLHGDKWVFIEEARNLQGIIQEFSAHPVTTQKVYWEGKYKIELDAYFERYNNTDDKVDDSVYEDAGIDLESCREERDNTEKEIKKRKLEELSKCPS